MSILDPFTSGTIRKYDIGNGAVYNALHKPSSSPDTTASDTFAALTRQQWQDYITNFVPYENKLIQYATDPTVVSNNMSLASQNVNQAFDQQAGTTQRRLSGLGLTLDADEQKVADRSTSLARAAADVNAQNTVRDQTMARQQSILGNPAPTIGGLAGSLQ